MIQMFGCDHTMENTDVMSNPPFLFVKQDFGCIMTEIFSVRWSAWLTELNI
jgi:hypothetical protein